MGETPSVQLENGYTRIASEWLEVFIAAKYPVTVKDFVLAIARETWGWNETWREVPLPRLAELMGTSEQLVKRARDIAFRHNLIEWEPGTGHNSSARYRVQKDYLDWIDYRSTAVRNRVSGLRNTGNRHVSGYNAVTSNNAVPTSGYNAVPGDRIQRGTHLIDKDRQGKTEHQKTLSENAETASAPSDPTSELESLKAAKARRAADRLRQQTERLDTARAALTDTDRALLDRMLLAQQQGPKHNGRPLTVLQEAQAAELYAKELTEHGAACWRDCCEKALASANGAVEYARACTKTWVPQTTFSGPTTATPLAPVPTPATKPLDPDFAKRWDEERNARRLTDAN